MKRIVFFITRFSVLEKKVTSWRYGDSNLVFSKDRLSLRTKTFYDITVNTISKQTISCNTEVEFWHLVLTSDILPQETMQKLREIEQTNRFMHIVLVESGDESIYSENTYVSVDDAIRASISKVLDQQQDEVLFATVNLDDDDGICRRYLEMLADHMSEKTVGYGVSFARGFKVGFNYEDSTLENLRHWYFPKVNVGLAYINRYRPGVGATLNEIFHILNAGSHTNIDAKIPVIVDGREPAYIYTMNNTNDSGDDDGIWLELPQANPTQIERYFPSQFKFSSKLHSEDVVARSEPPELPPNKAAGQHRLMLMYARREASMRQQIMRILSKLKAKLGRFFKK